MENVNPAMGEAANGGNQMGKAVNPNISTQ